MKTLLEVQSQEPRDFSRGRFSEHNISSTKYVGPVKRVIDEVLAAEVVVEKPVIKDSVQKIEKAETKTAPSPIVRSEHKAAVASDNNLEHRSRRNKKRRTRQLDIDLT